MRRWWPDKERRRHPKESEGEADERREKIGGILGIGVPIRGNGVSRVDLGASRGLFRGPVGPGFFASTYPDLGALLDMFLILSPDIISLVKEQFHFIWWSQLQTTLI